MSIPVFSDYVTRFADLIVELDNEKAALLVLSIESDPASAVQLVYDMAHNELDTLANRLYAMYAVNEVNYVPLQLAIEYFKKEYRKRNLTESLKYANVPETDTPTDEGNLY